MHVKVQRDGHDVEIAGALAVAEERAFDAVRAGEQAQFRRRHAGAAVVVRVQADDERVAVLDVPANPFDLVGIDVRHGHLDRVRQIQNHLALRRGLPDVHDRFGDFLGELHFRGAEAFRRILEHDFRALEPGQTFLESTCAPRTATRDDFLLGHAEHDAALRRGGGVVEVDDGLLRADQRLEGALDQILARLHEHLEPHVVRRAVFLDEPAVEGELGVRGGREADLDFLEAALSRASGTARVSGRRSSGTASAWLPSRKSTLHQMGARVRTRFGHWRSGKWTGGNGRYFADGFFEHGRFAF